MRRVSAALALIALCGAPSLAAADSFDPVSVGLQASTLGFGVTLERPLLFNLSARVATGSLSSSDQQTYGGSPWTRTVHESNVLVAADWRPYAGRYRLSAGLLLGNDHTDYTVKSVNGTTYVINGTSYPVANAGIVGARVAYPHPALYLGVGGGTGITRGFTFSFDAGLVLRNGATTASATGALQSDPGFQANLQTVAAGLRTQSVQPVLDVGLVFRP
jgi:hypothetical protein